VPIFSVAHFTDEAFEQLLIVTCMPLVIHLDLFAIHFRVFPHFGHVKLANKPLKCDLHIQISQLLHR
jgi:hypothetical protein